MSILRSALVGATLFGAAPALAINVIEAGAGEACVITVLGQSSCVWQDEDGNVTSATVTVEHESVHNQFGGSVRITDVPLSGLIEVHIPYVANTWDYHWATGLTRFATLWGRTTDPSARAIGTVSVVSEYDGISCLNSSGQCLTKFDVNSHYIGGFQSFDFHRLCCAMGDDGTWKTSIAWTFRDDASLSFILFRQFLNVPEPATWAMLIAGFGLVGGMARRRRQLPA